jgi:uncharacterized protein (DUF1800 family)
MRPLITAGALAATAAAALTAAPAADQLAQQSAADRNDRATIEHVLNRVTFGPRPGDVERVEGIGLARFIEQQLNPGAIPDPAMASRLSGLSTTRLSAAEITQQYELPLLEARREQRQAMAAAGAPAGGDGADGAMQPPQMRPRGPQQQGTLVLVELAEQKLLRAVYSERQLEEVLTDFWFNHFNVDARKGRVRFMVTAYERDTIRPHVLANFRDLLGATAKSPAMLFYLDNWMSVAPGGPRAPDVGRRRGRRPPQAAPRPEPAGRAARRGLNENYARELLELHTLGVDGGYTQHDVTEVARAFTGWTLASPAQGGGFRFQPSLHDGGEKIVLGRTIRSGGGMSDGERVLDILARHPSTARFIAMKLVRRFVSDTPPESLVARAAQRFTATDGNLREVMRTILTAPESLGAEWRGAKAKTPLEFVASAIRATEADIVNARPLIRTLQEHGMPLYQCQPPTGYEDAADAWMSTGALVLRMNFATALTSGRQPGVRVTDTTLAALDLGGPAFQRR